jgi:drug/metabolite transporter superfamily protein YnfA
MNGLLYPLMAWFVFVVAAALEVGGDAVVRKGLRGGGMLVVAGGCLMLAGYGLVVNMVAWDFSKLLGVYVAIFAIVSVLVGRFVFDERIPPATWVGLGVIVIGGLIIQFGGATKS